MNGMEWEWECECEWGCVMWGDGRVWVPAKVVGRVLVLRYAATETLLVALLFPLFFSHHYSSSFLNKKF